MTTYDYAKPLSGEEQFITRPDGTRLRTVSIGEGPTTAVLAHGYASSADSWNLIADMLADDGLRVIAFDQRGHGKSTIGAGGIGTPQMADDYGAVLEHYDVSNGILVGHSMGGFLSVAFLVGDSEAKTRISSLLLMSTFAGDVNRENPQNKLQIPLIKSGILTKLVGFTPVAKAFTKSLVGNDFQPGMVDAFIPTFLQADHAKLVPILAAMVDENRYDQLGRIDMPATVVVGSADKTTPPFHTADLHAGISGSALVTLPGVGHAPNWEAPDKIVSEIQQLSTKMTAL